MPSFVRRFLFDPGDQVLLEIESVNILDLDPPAAIAGVGSGTAQIVSEFENGPFNTPYQLGSATDLLQTFGDLGYNYNGLLGQNPCARSRKADGALVAEYWNGNGFVQLSGKKFASLIAVRVDTSVGAVQFSREAGLKGVPKFTYNLEPAQHLDVDIGAGPVVATFSATAATVTSTGEAFGTIVAGDTVVFDYDNVNATHQFSVTFLGTDLTNTACVARINQAAGFTFAAVSTTHIAYTARQRGTGSKVVVVSGTSTTLTKLGITAATTNGTGNVADIDNVTLAEANTVVSAAVTGAFIQKMADGTPRIVNQATPLTGSITVKAASTALDFGFPIESADAAATGTAGVIPAGTRVSDGASNHFVTMQDVVVTAASAGPYSVKVRHATDDGTGVTANAGAVSTVEQPIDIDSFTVLNPLILTPALTEAQIDAQYLIALAATLDINSVSKLTNLSWSARQSNSIRRALRQNALDASAGGCQGRLAIIRPPLGTTKTVAKSGVAEPGVGPYRDQRVVYTYPGVATNVPRIGQLGLSGGVGFTANGTVDIGSDGFLASVCSQLPPEENPGQDTGFLGQVLSLESSPNAQGFQIGDYTQFKAAGICAPIVDAGQASFQSGVTSVDPALFPQLKNIARRRMADFIQDSLGQSLKTQGKKLNKKVRRDLVSGLIRTFMRGLMGLTNPQQQRIAGFTLDDKSGNTGTSIGKGMYRLILNARTLNSLDSIVLQTTIGEQVQVQELAPGEIQ